MTLKENTVDVQLLQDFAAAWNRHDIEALMGFMADECTFHGTAGPDILGRTFNGRKEVREGFELAWKTFPNAAWLDGDHFVCGNRGVSESTFCGTKADGLRVHARMVDVFTFRDGKIATKNAYRKERQAAVSTYATSNYL
ncbi:Ketosteroid isomerase-related protein [Polaromonas sp. CG9_12]|nr:Ketosteroid isomerase-related protein [Polaromonas sp. CG9_12]